MNGGIEVAKQHPLQRIVQAQKRGIPTGVYSICSAHKYVIRAGLKQAIKADIAGY